jgi:hypothetical protein
MDGSGSVTESRTVLARCCFRGEPGRDDDAALGWASELKYYFGRRVGEAPVVTYANGIYTCEGLMTTSCPYDASPVTVFSTPDNPWDLAWALDAERLKFLAGTGQVGRWG